MPPKKRFSDVEKGIILCEVRNGLGSRSIAEKYGWRPTSVQYYASQVRKTGTIQTNRGNSGRKRKTDVRTDRIITRAVVGTPQKRRKSSRDLCMELGLEITPRTVRNRLKEKGLNGKIAVVKPLLRPANIVKRMQWARDHLSWTESDWENVLWSDESPFVLFGGSTRSWVRRRENERLHPHCVDARVKHGGGKLNVWGCFTANGVGSITRINGTMDQAAYKNILVHHARPSLHRLNAKIFQQDNDPKHKAKDNMSYLTGKRWPADILEWPSQSPDLNPIENLWSYLDAQVRKRRTKPKNLNELYMALEEEWKRIDPNYLKNLVKSMPRRCQAVVDAKGYWTKY